MADAVSPHDVDAAAIAVVGMACHLPGADSPASFWRNLLAGVESVDDFDEDALIAAGVPDALRLHPHYVPRSPQLAGLKQFDASFFGLSPKDAAIMDPQHRHFLECAWEALEDAGHDPARFAGPIGVFGGCGMNNYYFQNLLRDPALFEEVGPFLLRHTGNDKDFLSTFVSYKLDLRGPSIGVQTACSTSLVAVHLAAQSLFAGECDLALAGGSTIDLPHGQGYLFRENEILAQDGRCRPFDARATGTLFGSGAGMVVLRRLEDALADGDCVRAVLLGSAVNNDGAHKAGWLAPSVQGQADAAIEALAVAGIDPASVSFIEAHGTGTAVGDPIEVQALAQAYASEAAAPEGTVLGSVKANIGHLDTAAGVVSLIKAVQALQHRAFPPNPHFESPNPQLALEGTPFTVQAPAKRWDERALPLRGAVNSLGVGGTNAHVVLEQAPAQQSEAPAREAQLLPLAARTPQALAAACERLAAQLEEQPALSIADVAFTLQEGRRAFTQRHCVVASTPADAVASLRAAAERVARRDRPARASAGVGFLFPGGGAQYPSMAAGLRATEPVFREALDRGLQLLRERHGLDLDPVFRADAGQDEAVQALLDRPSHQLPAIFLVEIALAELWRSLGVEPDALLGHSLGENAAATVAGVFQFDEALDLVVLRGQLFEQLPPGGMLSVAAPADALEEILPDPLVVGAHNAPEQTMVSGPVDALGGFADTLETRGFEFQRVKIDCAAHSPALDPILAEFRARLESMQLSEPEIPLISNLTGTWLTAEEAQDPEYWVRHLRHTVRFAEGAAELLADEGRVLLEVGPGKILGSLARQQPAAAGGRVVLASLRHPDEVADDQQVLLEALGALWQAGVDVDWSLVRGPEARLRVPLPTYPFERQDFWVEPKVALGERPAPEDAGAERVDDLNAWFSTSTWVRRPAQARASTQATERWLVFLDRHGRGSALVKSLRAQGHDVVTVREGDAFYRFDADTFALAPEGGRAGYDALLQDLVAQERAPQRIVHLWSLTDSCDPRPGSSLFHHHQERGFYSLLFLAQAMGDQEIEAVELNVVANDLQRVVDGDPLLPEKSTLLGPVLVMPREMPGVRTRAMDLPRDARDETLLDELLRAEPESLVAWRDGERYVAVRQPLATTDEASSDAVEVAGSTVLITGGLGELGLATARHLATRGAARLVLVGRRALPPRARWDDWLATHLHADEHAQRIRAVRALEEAGAQVLLVAADVANPQQMRHAVEGLQEELDQLDLVIHTAGVLEDGVMQLRSPEAVERVFAPKVHGAQVLRRALAPLQPKAWLWYSSTSVTLGPAGQADYVAANAYLNALATAAQPDQAPEIAINWGVWQELGMAERLAVGLRRREPLKGEQRRLEDAVFDAEILDGARHRWRSLLHPASSWWLDEHRLATGRAVLPGTAYLELTRRAVERLAPGSGVEIEEFHFLAACPVPDDATRELLVSLQMDGEAWRVEIKSALRPEGPWELHAQGRVRAVDAAPQPLTSASGPFGEVVQPSPRLQPAHLRLGPRWDGLYGLQLAPRRAQAQVELAPAFAEDLARDAWHPALLDLATGVGVHLIDAERASDAFWVPVEYGRIHGGRPLPSRVQVDVELRALQESGEPEAELDMVLSDPAGAPLLEVRGLRLRGLASHEALCRHDDGERESLAPSEHTPAERAFLRMIDSGIRESEGMAALDRVLASPQQAVVHVSSMDLDGLLRLQDRASEAWETGASEVRFERPALASAYVAPRNAIERRLVQWWQELLGVDQVGVHDEFFELGGHSLIAVRLFSRIKQEFGVEHPLSVLFEAPTIAAYAALLAEDLGVDAAKLDDDTAQDDAAPARMRRRHRYLVPMNDVRESTAPPFFLVAGMFGNVLNLRHLAMHLGEDRQVYAIQAAGLREEEVPHRRFEDMASAYLEEIRAVQPHGPYLLGGFSGGGITAFEMAQQLRAAGEETAALVLLDTPIPRQPEANWKDRARIFSTRVREEGPTYPFRWIKRRVAWEWQRRRRRSSQDRAGTPAEFRSELVKDAFLEAVEHYELQPYPGLLTLFRPKLMRRFELAGGRWTNEFREIQDVCNHWLPYAAGGIDTYEVDGDHDSMVLEPHVRVLGPRMRESLVEAMQEWRKSQTPSQD